MEQTKPFYAYVFIEYFEKKNGIMSSQYYSKIK